MLPNFLHVGASKAASSWLWRVCIEHPDIYVPNPPDNVNFFTVHYHRGMDWYEKTYFEGAGDETAVGEFSNSYMVYAPAMERIARHLPDVRLSMTLRKPAEALYLSWAHLHLKDKPYGLDPRKGIGIPLEKCLHHHGHAWFRLYMDPRFYARHIERIYTLIPPERVRIFLYDDLCRDQEGFLHDYFEFIGADPDFRSSLVGKDVNPDAPDADIERDLSREFRAELAEVFREDVERLGEMLGRDLSHWLQT